MAIRKIELRLSVTAIYHSVGSFPDQPAHRLYLMRDPCNRFPSMWKNVLRSSSPEAAKEHQLFFAKPALPRDRLPRVGGKSTSRASTGARISCSLSEGCPTSSSCGSRRVLVPPMDVASTSRPRWASVEQTIENPRERYLAVAADYLADCFPGHPQRTIEGGRGIAEGTDTTLGHSRLTPSNPTLLHGPP